MPEAMTSMQAVKSFLNQGASKEVSNSELMAFWKGLTPEEKKEYSEGAAKSLGVELKAAQPV